VFEDRASHDRVVNDSAQHFRILALNFLDFRRDGPRQVHSQINGTRIPHTLILSHFGKIQIFY
jgi:hypothetical protein